MATHNVVAIVGSLRKESFSLKIAHALAKLAPASLVLDVTTLHDISFFNQDVEGAPPADWLPICKESFSLKIAHALAKLAPASLVLDVTTLHDISFFNQDVEGAPPADWL